MKRFWLQTLLLLLLAAFQFSFINMAFGSAWLAPNILISVSIIWMLREDFRSVIGRIIALGLLYDLISGTSVGMTAILLLWFAYVTSFLSKRFLVEHSGSGFVLAGVLASLFSVASIIMERLLSPVSRTASNIVSSDWVSIFLPYVPAVFLVNFCSFLILAFFLSRFSPQPFSDRLDPLFRG